MGMTRTPYSPAWWLAEDKPPAVRPAVRWWRLNVSHRVGFLAGVAVTAIVAFSLVMVLFHWAWTA